MCHIFNLFGKVYYGAMFLYTKLKYFNGVSLDGFSQIRKDTQIKILDNGKIHIGKNVSFQRNVSIGTVGGKIDIGQNVAFNRNCIVACRNKIIIGEDVIIGPGVTIYDHDHCFSKKGILKDYKLGEVQIENGCWIAANVTILRGTFIGEGCVIGAGIVLKGTIPPHSLVIGNRDIQIHSIKG